MPDRGGRTKGMSAHPFADADARLVAAAKDLQVLKLVAWPESLAERFLAAWEAGRPEIPEPPPLRLHFDPPLEELDALSRPASDHPAAQFVAETAASYAATVRMLQGAGTPEFTRWSIELYGRPRDEVLPGGPTHLTAAERFMETTSELQGGCFVTDADLCYTPQHVRDEVDRRSQALFGDRNPRIELDDGLAAKAAAGAERIRIRTATCFSGADLEQLWYHEACVHTATALNGRLQPHLATLSLNAPRTTATQEGLATFSELVTGSIDLARLRRLALRVKAIDLALDGADFIDLFKFFLEAGQGERESYYSTARIFRGGDPRGGAVFTKDGVYLKGLLEVYTFLHESLAQNRVERTRNLFAGRMTCPDVVSLEPLFEDGTVAPPRFEPDWLQRRNQLAAYLAFSSLANSLPL